MTTPFDLAGRYLAALFEEAQQAGLDKEAVERAAFTMLVGEALQTRAPKDIEAEIGFIIENADPDTDFTFMRP